MVSPNIETVFKLNKLHCAVVILAVVQLNWFVVVATEFVGSDTDQILIAEESSTNYNKVPYVNSSISDGFQFKWFQQNLTHLNASDTRHWLQRYFEYGGYHKQGGPVFLQIDGEGPGLSSPLDLIKKGSMAQYAKEQGAFIVALEHRFYGHSHPTLDLSNDNLKFLNIQEAIEDTASFISWLKIHHNFQNNKWVLFGSSYGGSLAKWFMQSYPNMTDILVASSAPLELKYEMPDYLEMVGNVINKTSSQCYKDLTEGFACLEDTVNNKSCGNHSHKSNDLQKMFNLCGEFKAEQEMDTNGLFYTIFNIFNNIVVNNIPNPNLSVSLEGICRNLNTSVESIDSPLEKLTRTVRLITEASEVSCIEYRLDKIVKYLQSPSWKTPASIIGDRQFEWQRCNQIGWIKGSNEPKLPFGKRISTNFHAEICKQVFGISEELTRTGIETANKIFKGKFVEAECSIFINGNADPWSVLGILSDKEAGECNQAIIIEGASHAKDKGNIQPEETTVISYPPDLQRAQREIGKTLSTWIKSGNCCRSKFNINQTIKIDTDNFTSPDKVHGNGGFSLNFTTIPTTTLPTTTDLPTTTTTDNSTFQNIKPEFPQTLNSTILTTNDIIAEDSKRYETRTFMDPNNIDQIYIDKGVEFKALSDFVKKHENEFFTPDAANKRYRVKIRRDGDNEMDGKKTFSKFGIKIRMIQPKEGDKSSEKDYKFKEQWGHWTDFETKKSINPETKILKLNPITKADKTAVNNHHKGDLSNLHQNNNHRPVHNSNHKHTHQAKKTLNENLHQFKPVTASETVEEDLVPTTLKQENYANRRMDERGDTSLLILKPNGKNEEISVYPETESNTQLSNEKDNIPTVVKPKKVKVRRVKVKRLNGVVASQSRRLETSNLEDIEGGIYKPYKYRSRLISGDHIDGHKRPRGSKEYTSDFSDELSPSKLGFVPVSENVEVSKISKTSHEDGPSFLNKEKVHIIKLKDESMEIGNENSVEEAISSKKTGRIPGIWKLSALESSHSSTGSFLTGTKRKKSKDLKSASESTKENLELSNNSKEDDSIAIKSDETDDLKSNPTPTNTNTKRNKKRVKNVHLNSNKPVEMENTNNEDDEFNKYPTFKSSEEIEILDSKSKSMRKKTKKTKHPKHKNDDDDTDNEHLSAEKRNDEVSIFTNKNSNEDKPPIESFFEEEDESDRTKILHLPESKIKKSGKKTKKSHRHLEKNNENDQIESKSEDEEGKTENTKFELFKPNKPFYADESNEEIQEIPASKESENPNVKANDQQNGENIMDFDSSNEDSVNSFKLNPTTINKRKNKTRQEPISDSIENDFEDKTDSVESDINKNKQLKLKHKKKSKQPKRKNVSSADEIEIGEKEENEKLAVNVGMNLSEEVAITGNKNVPFKKRKHKKSKNKHLEEKEQPAFPEEGVDEGINEKSISPISSSEEIIQEKLVAEASEEIPDQITGKKDDKTTTISTEKSNKETIDNLNASKVKASSNELNDEVVNSKDDENNAGESTEDNGSNSIKAKFLKGNPEENVSTKPKVRKFKLKKNRIPLADVSSSSSETNITNAMEDRSLLNHSRTGSSNNSKIQMNNKTTIKPKPGGQTLVTSTIPNMKVKNSSATTTSSSSPPPTQMPLNFVTQDYRLENLINYPEDPIISPLVENIVTPKIKNKIPTDSKAPTKKISTTASTGTDLKSPATSKSGISQNLAPKMFMTSEGKAIPMSHLNWRSTSSKLEPRVVDMSTDHISKKLILTPDDVAWVNFGIPFDPNNRKI